jgi:hypothetical protein
MVFTHPTRIIAFADDLLVLIRGKWALDSENHANQELKKIENWARENKMYFNENKPKVLLVTKETSRDNRTPNIYLNSKRLEEVSEIKYLKFIKHYCFDQPRSRCKSTVTDTRDVMHHISPSPFPFPSPYNACSKWWPYLQG